MTIPKKPLVLLGALAVALAGIASSSNAASSATSSLIVRPAPQFPVNTNQTLKQFKGQPVVIIVAPSPRSSAFRKQVRRMEKAYSKFASRKTIFVAAFTQNPSGEGAHSSIPFVYAQDGAALSQHYGADPQFSLIVVGTDGNLDLITSKISAARKAYDAILNNATLQTAERRAL